MAQATNKERTRTRFFAHFVSVGPNHTLPTGGLARSFSGLSVHSFLKKQTFLEIHSAQIDVSGAEAMMADAVEMGLMEGKEFDIFFSSSFINCVGLHGHSRAARLRLERPPASLAPGIARAPSQQQHQQQLKLALPKGRMQDNILELMKGLWLFVSALVFF